MLYILALLISQQPVEMTIVVADCDIERCDRSKFVLDSFTASCEQLEGILSASRSARGDTGDPSAQSDKTSALGDKSRRFVTDYHERLAELREECQPWNVCSWRELGLTSDTEVPSWTVQRRHPYRLHKIREDVLWLHEDLLLHIRYLKALHERDKEISELVIRKTGISFRQLHRRGVEKWLRNDREEFLEDSMCDLYTPIVAPWPPVPQITRTHLDELRIIGVRTRQWSFDRIDYEYTFGYTPEEWFERLDMGTGLLVE